MTGGSVPKPFSEEALHDTPLSQLPTGEPKGVLLPGPFQATPSPAWSPWKQSYLDKAVGDENRRLLAENAALTARVAVLEAEIERMTPPTPPAAPTPEPIPTFPANALKWSR